MAPDQNIKTCSNEILLFQAKNKDKLTNDDDCEMDDVRMMSGTL